jgi:hypothetical protein
LFSRHRFDLLGFSTIDGNTVDRRIIDKFASPPSAADGARRMLVDFVEMMEIVEFVEMVERRFPLFH